MEMWLFRSTYINQNQPSNLKLRFKCYLTLQGELLYAMVIREEKAIQPYLQVVWLNGCKQLILGELTEHIWGHDLAELLTQKMHGLSVDPFWAVRLRTPLQNGDQRLQRHALHNDILTTWTKRGRILFSKFSAKVKGIISACILFHCLQIVEFFH